MSIQSDVIAGDIRSFIQAKIREVEKWESNPKVREIIEIRLMEKAHGM
jgi:hypothetical protein